MVFHDFKRIWGGQKACNMNTFSKHENIDLDMLYSKSEHLGGPKIEKNDSTNMKKNIRNMTYTKH